MLFFVNRNLLLRVRLIFCDILKLFHFVFKNLLETFLVLCGKINLLDLVVPIQLQNPFWMSLQECEEIEKVVFLLYERKYR